MDNGVLSSGIKPLPANCTMVAFDLGTNDGADTRSMLRKGFCVVGVDANPVALQAAIASIPVASQGRVRLVNAGLAETPGNLSFYGAIHFCVVCW